jgi:hypothetical protein
VITRWFRGGYEKRNHLGKIRRHSINEA